MPGDATIAHRYPSQHRRPPEPAGSGYQPGGGSVGQGRSGGRRARASPVNLSTTARLHDPVLRARMRRPDVNWNPTLEPNPNSDRPKPPDTGATEATSAHPKRTVRPKLRTSTPPGRTTVGHRATRTPSPRT